MNLVTLLIILYCLDVSLMSLFHFIFRVCYGLYKTGNVVQLKKCPYFFVTGEGSERVLNILNSIFNPLENTQGLVDLLKFDDAYEEYVFWEVENGYILGEDVDIDEEKEISTVDEEIETNNIPSCAKKVVGYKKVYQKRIEEDIQDKSLDEEIDYLLEKLENAYLRKASDLGILDDPCFMDKLNDKTSVKKRVKCLQKAIKKWE